ncbi:hypothetical protein LR48_Vigan01g181600 [Vigna angularis]|uniref:Uncharacterized protein n=1 Tax=Phaseolus angularis TaxID=3914 RepID=A0A0L9TNY0_PHAAN|nr:hypothetical protein LR48_Vigan01g181600 [Vigna angularis]
MIKNEKLRKKKKEREEEDEPIVDGTYRCWRRSHLLPSSTADTIEVSVSIDESHDFDRLDQATTMSSMTHSSKLLRVLNVSSLLKQRFRALMPTIQDDHPGQPTGRLPRLADHQIEWPTNKSTIQADHQVDHPGRSSKPTNHPTDHQIEWPTIKSTVQADNPGRPLWSTAWLGYKR